MPHRAHPCPPHRARWGHRSRVRCPHRLCGPVATAWGPRPQQRQCPGAHTHRKAPIGKRATGGLARGEQGPQVAWQWPGRRVQVGRPGVPWASTSRMSIFVRPPCGGRTCHAAAVPATAAAAPPCGGCAVAARSNPAVLCGTLWRPRRIRCVHRAGCRKSSPSLWACFWEGGKWRGGERCVQSSGFADQVSRAIGAAGEASWAGVCRGAGWGASMGQPGGPGCWRGWRGGRATGPPGGPAREPAGGRLPGRAGRGVCPAATAAGGFGAGGSSEQALGGQVRGEWSSPPFGGGERGGNFQEQQWVRRQGGTKSAGGAVGLAQGQHARAWGCSWGPGCRPPLVGPPAGGPTCCAVQWLSSTPPAGCPWASSHGPQSLSGLPQGCCQERPPGCQSCGGPVARRSGTQGEACTRSPPAGPPAYWRAPPAADPGRRGSPGRPRRVCTLGEHPGLCGRATLPPGGSCW